MTGSRPLFDAHTAAVIALRSSTVMAMPDPVDPHTYLQVPTGAVVRSKSVERAVGLVLIRVGCRCRWTSYALCVFNVRVKMHQLVARVLASKQCNKHK